MRNIHFSTILVLLSLIVAEPAFCLNNYNVWLRAHPQAIVADSMSSTTISAEVKDANGRSVPDGTTVDFTSSLGIIDRSAPTAAGVARVRLQSGNTTGTAIISAVVSAGNAVAQLRVDLLEPGTEMFNESFISVTSPKHLGYDVNSRTVDAAGGVTIYHRGVTIEAEEAQIDAKKNIIRALAKMGGTNITISCGGKKLAASALYYDFNSMNGVIITTPDDGAKRMLFRGRDLFTQPDTKPEKNVTFELTPISESSMFIKAKSLVIRPGEEIKIKRANFYLEGDKVLSVPLHVVPLSSKTGGMDRMLTYGTDGLRLDMPIYFSLTPNGTGAVRLKHSEQSQWGYYSGSSGWQADIEQEYNINGSTQGTFLLNKVTSGEWGARWNNRMEFNNNSQVYTYLDFPSHKDLYGTVDYRRQFKGYTMSAGFRGNKLQNLDTRYSSNLALQTTAKPLISNAITYAVTSRLSYYNQYSSDKRIGTGLGLQLYGKPLQFGSTSSLSTSFTVAHDWGGGYPGSSIYANAGYYRNLGNIGQFGLNYTYSWADSENAFSAQRLSADLSMRPSEKWQTRLYLTRGLTDKSTSAFGEFNYVILPTWRLGISATQQSFSGTLAYTYSDYELALSKIIGSQEGRLLWSKSHKRFRLELTALHF